MIFVTNHHTNDGFGSQFQVIICLILICIENGFQFIYNPICYIDHNYDGDPDFINKLNKLMNISSKFPTIESQEQVERLHIQICDTTVKYMVDHEIERFANEKSLSLLRDMFWENKDRSLLFKGDTSHTHVAIHIRRPNQHDHHSFDDKKTPDKCYHYRVNTPNDYYLNAIQIIRNDYHKGEVEKKPLLFHIYSQGEISMFDSFIADDTVLHIDQDIVTTFTEMVGADILMTSFSSFSYIAGFLNSGIVYYQHFWHPPRSNWIRV